MDNFKEIKQTIKLGDQLRDYQKTIENVQFDEDIKDSQVRGVMFGCNMLRSAISGMYSNEVMVYMSTKGLGIVREYLNDDIGVLHE